ncbi:hypothetical protein EVAR_61548_1 [Eumeta japonica]|uniref:Uncharacterized protein n=1 Tax=Eumeta variegata TaxID=151549 RepID=A0A4C1Z673_EUMVA|nr:hypothetical protein EVAR_61548_1 [Eumeta japonica]
MTLPRIRFVSESQIVKVKFGRMSLVRYHVLPPAEATPGFFRTTSQPSKAEKSEFKAGVFLLQYMLIGSRAAWHKRRCFIMFTKKDIASTVAVCSCCGYSVSDGRSEEFGKFLFALCDYARRNGVTMPLLSPVVGSVDGAAVCYIQERSEMYSKKAV